MIESLVLRAPRSIFFHLTVIALFLLAPSLLRAQADNITITATGGFATHFKAGKWFPVFVDISNQPNPGQSVSDLTEFEGQIALPASPADNSGEIRFSRRVSVPPASTKRYVLYAKYHDTKDNASVPLQLSAKNGKLLKSQDLQISSVAPDKLLVVNVGSSGRSTLPRSGENLDGALGAQISPDELADFWPGLEAADIIILDGWPDKGLREGSVHALQDWVTMGGTLVITGGMHEKSYADAVATALLPINMEGTGKILQSGESFKMSTEAGPPPVGQTAFIAMLGKPKAGAEVMQELDGWPLLTRRQQGKGQVVFFACDLQSQSPELEKYLSSAWQAITPLPNLASDWYFLPRAVREFKSITGGAARPPNGFLIILICIIYILVVGPLNFGILSKKKKVEWAWVTVPAIVFVFFFLLYGIGRLTKGSNSILRELSVEEYRQGESFGSALTVTNTFVSGAGSHFLKPVAERGVISDSYQWFADNEFRSQNRFANMAAAIGGQRLSSTPIVSYDVKQVDGATQEAIQVTTWPMGVYDAWGFVGGGPAQMDGAVDADITWGLTGPQGDVTNNTGTEFSDAWLLFGPDVLHVGALKNGEKTTILSTDLLSRYNSGVGGSRWVASAGYFASRLVARPQTDADVNNNNIAQIMTGMFEPGTTGQRVPPRNGSLYFVGIRSGAKADGLITSITPDMEGKTTLTLVKLDIKVRPHMSMVMPGAYVQQRFINYDLFDKGEFYIDDSQLFNMHESEAMFSAELPFSDPNIQITAISFGSAASIPQGAQDFAISVYRQFPRPAWVKISPNVAVPNEGYTLPGSGRIFYRLTATTPAQPPAGSSGGFDSTVKSPAINIQYMISVP